MPVPNRGDEAAALMGMAAIAEAIQHLLGKFPASSEASRDFRRAIDLITKHANPNTASPGGMNAARQKMMMQSRQAGPQIAAQRAAQMGGGQGPPGGAPPPPMGQG
jgi:hypothetical protein